MAVAPSMAFGKPTSRRRLSKLSAKFLSRARKGPRWRSGRRTASLSFARISLDVIIIKPEA